MTTLSKGMCEESATFRLLEALGRAGQEVPHDVEHFEHDVQSHGANHDAQLRTRAVRVFAAPIVQQRHLTN